MSKVTEVTAAEWPPHKHEWESFLWEIGEHPQWHSHFGSLSDLEARRVWTLIEDQLFSKYNLFVRVWPDWCSSGLWHVPYPGSRYAGKNLDPEEHLGISAQLHEAFERWQESYDSHEPFAPEQFDWPTFNKEEERLTQVLKRELGKDVYVEREGLREMLIDGTTRNWRHILGLPEAISPK
jgi:hypothetical protein